jgi:transmembrane 9 superfamily protein 2/4
MVQQNVLSVVMWLMVGVTQGFYLPGVAPRDYAPGEAVLLKVNKLTSVRTQLPYDYYHLPFCEPAGGIQESRENLGEVLTGNVIENSAYVINMRDTVECATLCKKTYKKADIDKFVSMIEESYVVNWIMDNLPAAYRTVVDHKDVAYYQRGFPLGGRVLLTNSGKKETIKHYVNNHVDIRVDYHNPKPLGLLDDSSEEVSRVVGLIVEPFSVKHKTSGKWNTEDESQNTVTTCPTLAEVGKDVPNNHIAGMIIDGSDSVEVVWTYSVQWHESDVKWASRWDVYLSSKGTSDIHWFSIVNSLLIVAFLTGMVALIMVRALHKDLSRYNKVPTDEEKAEEREETGWKLVHGDVLRPPSNPLLFSVTVGTGFQVFCMAALTIVFAALGFLSPANRGSVMIALLLLFMFMGIGAGYTSARTYKMFNGAQWQRCTLGTAFLYPMIVCGLVFFLNLFVWAEGSSSAIPFGTMIGVLALWFLISVPLTFLGAFYGYKRDVDKQPVQTQEIPRAIPEQPWYMTPTVTILVGGVLPFGAVFVELFFILTSIWLDTYYYVFGFLLLVFAILIITCAEISIVLCYFQLCSEDYNWWWRSFLTSGSSAFYLFLYSAFYYSSKLKMDLMVSTILYFGYMFILSILFFLATGVIGYYSCLMFVLKIYSSVKVD